MLGCLLGDTARGGLSGLFLTGGLTWITGAVGVAWLKKLEGDFWSWLESRPSRRTAAPAAATPAAAAPTVTPIAPAPVATANIPEQIKKLAELREMGILTVEEFDAKKKELLSRL